MQDRTRTWKRDALHLAGVTYAQKWIPCSRAGCCGCPHGPYWYASFRARDGAHRTRYIGRDMPRALERMRELLDLEVGLAVRRSLASSLRAAVRTATRIYEARELRHARTQRKTSAARQRSA